MPRLLVALLLLLLAGPSLAQVSDGLAEAYVETTHLDEAIASIAEQFTAQIGMQAGQLPEPAREPFVEIYGAALSPDALAERLETYVAEAGDADSIRAVLAWYEQPLAQEMQAIERAADDDDQAQVALQMYAMTGAFTDYTPSPERQAQMDRYLEVSGSTGAFVDLYTDVIVASAGSMQEISGEEPPPADSIRAVVRPQLENQIVNSLRGGLLYTYREVEDDTVDAYLDLLDEPAARYTNRLGPAAMSAALVGALTDAGEAFSQRLMELDAAGEIDLDAMRAEMEQRAAQQRQMQQSQGMEDGEPMDDEPTMEDDGMEMEDDG